MSQASFSQPAPDRVQVFCTAFEGARRIASGPLSQVALAVKEVLDRGERAPVLIFDDQDSQLVELDLRGTPQDVVAKLASGAEAGPPAAAPEPREIARKPGRPRLGVVAREVTLLPRHWEWLNLQPGGASVALRKLVEEARRGSGTKERIRRARESAYRFMSAMAGNEAGFEEALRSLFAGDEARFRGFVESWPVDVRDHALRLASRAFDGEV